MGGKYYFDQFPPEERKRIAEECGLTEEEILVFEMRARKDRIVPTSMELGMSDSTVKRRSRSIARKLARAGHHACTRARSFEQASSN
ncbi:MAG: hypothetical protein IJ418_09160 [Clostridia bacterium]|nr:hypothetical protein [Clostridia bacterium]